MFKKSELITAPTGEAGATVLDIGCCFGQDLRLLAADGASPQNMYASNLRRELWDLGFELFDDREKMTATFIQADIQDPDSGLRELEAKIDVVIANQFLHLFDWEGLVSAMKKIVGLSRRKTVLIGYQRGQVPPKEIERPWGKMYVHDEETYRKIWQRVELETGTQWDVDVELVELSEWGMEKEDCDWMPDGKKGINFVVTRRS